MSERYIVTGTLTSARTVALDEAVPLVSAKVRVVVEPLPAAPRRPYGEVVATIRARQRRRGHRPRSRAAVDAALLEERASWEA